MRSFKHTAQIVVFCVCIFNAGCSSSPPQRSTQLEANSAKISASYRSEVLSIAKSMLGLPYRYGGTNPSSGFDCSGLIYYTHAQIGVELPRMTHDQFRETVPVAKSDLKPGDMVFFRSNRGRISHVGIYIGENRFIHAPGTGKYVSVTSLDNPYWKPRFVRGGHLRF